MQPKAKKKKFKESNSVISETKTQESLAAALKFSKRKILDKNLSSTESTASDNEISSSSEEEDDYGNLLTKKVERNIFDTLSMIKNKHDVIYDKNHVFFKDSDFVENSSEASEKEEIKNKDSKVTRGITYNNLFSQSLLNEGSNVFVEEETKVEEKLKGKKPLNYAEEQDALRKDFLLAVNDFADGKDIADDQTFLIPKKKTADEIEKEEKDFSIFQKRQSSKQPLEDSELMRHYWADDEELDEKERFLRDYILNQSWKVDTSVSLNDENISKKIDEEDEVNIQRTEQFEASFNFRFEEDCGTQLQSYSRHISNSLRRKDERRKNIRQRKRLRKLEEKQRNIDLLKQLKNKKKQEIVDRLEKIQDISHLNDLGPESEPWSGQNLDAHQTEELEDTLLDAVDAIVHDEAYAPLVEGEGDYNENEQEDNKNIVINSPEDDEFTWWLCDGCRRGIPAGERRFDCTICENFTLCKACYRKIRHPHRLMPKKVSKDCGPPEEAMMDSEDANELLDDYYQLDYEDIIGDLPTRFKYRQVTPDSCGLSLEDILTKSDGELNKIRPLKELLAIDNEYNEDASSIKSIYITSQKKFAPLSRLGQKHRLFNRFMNKHNTMRKPLKAKNL